MEPASEPSRPLSVDIGLVRVLVGVGLLAGTFWLVGALQGVISQLLIALAIAYILDPLVDRLERLVRSRGLAVVLLVVPLVGILGLTGALLIPRLIDEITDFIGKLPGMFDSLLRWSLATLVSRFQFEIPHSVGEVLQRFGAEIKEAVPGVLTAVQTAAAGLFSGGAGVFRVATGAVLVPIFAVYLLYDFDRIMAFLRSLVPRPYEGVVVEHMVEIDRAVASFLRGQLTVCLILASLYCLGFSLIGLKMALLLGVLIGVLAVVPYAGAFIGLVASLASSLVWFQSWWVVAGVVLVFLIVQTLDAVLITPRVLGQSINLSPVLVIIALMVGGKLLGFIGVLIAVPSAACVRVLGASLLRWYRTTAWYVGGSPTGGEARPADTPPPPAETARAPGEEGEAAAEGATTEEPSSAVAQVPSAPEAPPAAQPAPSAPAEPPATPAEVPPKSAEVPAESAEVPAESAEVPGESAEVPAAPVETPATASAAPTPPEATVASAPDAVNEPV